jgi:hypothetical protein
LGLTPDEYWAMLPSEFWLMCEGYREYGNQQYEFLRNTVFSALRWHAATTAMVDKSDRKKILNTTFPWEDGSNKPTKDDIISYDDVKGIFNTISKPADDG